MKFSIRFHDHIIHSIKYLVEKYGVPGTVIEIGCFEGETTFNMATQFIGIRQDYIHYVIDPYEAAPDFLMSDFSNVKSIFLENLQEFNSKYPGVVRFLNQESGHALNGLYSSGVKADLVYVDGNHTSKAVLEDLVLSFMLLKIGGIILIDDATTWRYGTSITDSPRIAVDSFIHCYWDHLEVLELPGGYQVALRKKSRDN